MGRVMELSFLHPAHLHPSEYFGVPGHLLVPCCDEVNESTDGDHAYLAEFAYGNSDDKENEQNA